MSEVVKERHFSRTGYTAVNWNYIVPGPPEGVNLFDNKERATLLARMACHIIRALAGFAEVGGISIHTDSPDDASYEVRFPNQEDVSKLDAYLQSTLDVSGITIWFDLKCVTRKPTDSSKVPKEIWDGWIFIHNYIKTDGTVDSDESLISVSFQFHNAIYWPAILSEEYLRDVELDAPMLSAFVHRLEKFPELRFCETEHEAAYGDWLQRHGLSEIHNFKLPESR